MPAAQRPNVLILFTDQQRHDTLAAAGFSHMLTPNLDRLARRGTLFTAAHSSNPVCMPARHDLLTGLPARAHGYYGNSHNPIADHSLATMPRIFQQAGYRTAAIGKCHHCPAREHHGFGELHLMEELPAHRADDQYATWLAQEGWGEVQNLHGVRPHVYHVPQNAQMDLAHHGTNWVADRTIQWLEENGGEPFFLFCGWIHPHPPWDLPPEVQDLYRDRKLPEPAPVSRAWPTPAEPGQWFGDHDSPEAKRRIREAYYASITLADRAIGRVLDALEARGELDNTLIIFTSDHGEMLQDKGYYSKEVPYEGSVRVPLIVKLPAGATPPAHLAPGGSCPAFADTLDLLPTCLEVCGLSYPAGGKWRLPGRSLTDPALAERQIQISSFADSPARRWVMARSRQHKYIYNYNGGAEELYDLETDPGETRNLFAAGTPPAEAAELRAAVLAWEKSWGPEWAVRDGRLAVQPRQAQAPWDCGKFHKWANTQFQAFDRRPPTVRGERFLEEIRHALDNQRHSGVKLAEVFNDSEWRAHFAECWRKYGTGDEILNQLFTTENG